MLIGRNMRVFVRQRHDAEPERRRRRRRRTCESDATDADPPAVAGATARRGCGEARRYHKAP